MGRPLVFSAVWQSNIENRLIASSARGISSFQMQEVGINYNVTPQVIIDTLTRVGLKIVGAIALFIIGRWLIKLASALVSKALNRQNMDATIVRYISSALSVTLNVILVGPAWLFRCGNRDLRGTVGRRWNCHWCRLEWIARKLRSRYFPGAPPAV